MSSLRQPSSWLLAASGLILYVWAPMLLAGEEVRTAGAVPAWFPVVAPPLLYAVLLLGLPGAPATRRLAGVVVLSVVHGLLGLLTPAIHALAGLGPAPHGFDTALWAFPAAPVIQLLSAPLAVFPLRDLLVRPRRRRGRRRPSVVGLAPTPTPMRAGRGWDAVTQHTVGGERLREEGAGSQVTPEWQRARREPTRPVAPPPEAAPSAPLASRPTPPVGPALTEAPEAPPVAEVQSPAPWRRIQRPAPVVAEPLCPPDVGGAPPVARVTPADEPGAPPVESAALFPAPAEPVVRPAEPAVLLLPPPPAVEPAILPLRPPADAAAVPEPDQISDARAGSLPGPSATAPVAGPLPATATEPEAPPTAAEARDEAPPAEETTIDGVQLEALLAPVGPLELEHQTLMGIALFTACSPRLARDAVVHAAFRFLSFLAEGPGAQPVTQATIRGGAGALVLTPLGPLAAGGPVLVAAIPQRGALALLEILSLRVAAEYRATRAARAARPSAPERPEVTPSRLAEAALPPRLEGLARSVTAGGPFRPLCLEDTTGRLLLYLLVGPDMDAGAVGTFASDLYRVMELDDEPGGVGPCQSVVVRFGSQRVVVRPVAATGEGSTLLVTAGPSGERPGLARLQLERLATRLAAPPG
ncbi:MAG: hypothetical protein HY359_14055 [Candidatus Rokubacteria bacterium]|nr:hypothetical protein [Candidatus Rokubacteria bacterium]